MNRTNMYINRILFNYDQNTLNLLKNLSKKERIAIYDILGGFLLKEKVRMIFKENPYDLIVDAYTCARMCNFEVKSARKLFYRELKKYNSIKGNFVIDKVEYDSEFDALIVEENVTKEQYHGAKSVKSITIRLPRKAYSILTKEFENRRSEFIDAIVNLWEIRGGGLLIEPDEKEYIKNIPVKVKLKTYFKLKSIANKKNISVPKVILLMWGTLTNHLTNPDRYEIRTS